jgi:pimeloyl-ACP methyl ester carboxylesterase
VAQAVPDSFMTAVISESLGLPIHVWRGIMAGMIAAERPVALGRSGIPALVMWGAKDPWAPRAEQDSLVAMLRNARLEVSPDLSHAPHWERPDVIARRLRLFIDGTKPAGE